MLDPDEFSDAQNNVGKKYKNSSAIGHLHNDMNLTPTSDKSDVSSDRDDDNVDEDDDLHDCFRTDTEVSKYYFFERLHRYMDCRRISLAIGRLSNLQSRSRRDRRCARCR